jgi:pterin-4a-carbinolamine dehydratase
MTIERHVVRTLNGLVRTHRGGFRRSCQNLRGDVTYSRPTNTHSERFLSSNRPDPFARRPNQKCDPYGQGGKPLGVDDAQRLLATVSDDWRLESQENGSDTPFFLVREFYHDDFLAGSSFVNEIAAVAQMNDHYPSITLERRLDSKKKAWRVVTTVKCHTKVLGGLSHHDFFLATVCRMS